MLELVRAADWWQYKLAPVVALFVATTLLERQPLLPLWRDVALLLVALAACAAYVSVINDLADRGDDAAAGKSNRQVGQPRGPVAAMLAATIATGAAVAWWWRDEPILLASYSASWLLFSLYSFPPFRLKTRGLAGVLCDAAGAHLAPALTTMLVASQRDRLDAAWMAAAAVWAFAYGLRGIIWHQLADYESDVRSGTRTFAVRRRAAAVRLGAFVAFPAELVALTVMLWRIAEPLPLVALACYAALLAVRVRSGGTLNLVVPRAHSTSVLHEYYDVFLPVALLLRVAATDWRALALLAAFVALFPNGIMRVNRDLIAIARAILVRVGVLRARTSS